MQGFFGQVELQQPVEQQTPGGETQPDHSLWVRNPRCGPVYPPELWAYWDADDSRIASAIGPLAPGEAFTFDLFLFADWTPHVLGVEATATKNDDVLLGISLPEIGFRQTRPVATPANSNKVQGHLYVLGPDYDFDLANPALSPVAGSNGGIAKLVTVRFSILNRGIRQARKVTAMMSIKPTFRIPAGVSFPYNANPSGAFGNPSIWWSE